MITKDKLFRLAAFCDPPLITRHLKWEWFLIKLPIGFSTSSFTNIWQLSGVPDKLPLSRKETAKRRGDGLRRAEKICCNCNRLERER
jgi:hypothetical protein